MGVFLSFSGTNNLFQCRISQLSQFNRKMPLSLILNALLMCLVIMDMVHIDDKHMHTFRQIWIQNNSGYSFRI